MPSGGLHNVIKSWIVVLLWDPWDPQHQLHHVLHSWGKKCTFFVSVHVLNISGFKINAIYLEKPSPHPLFLVDKIFLQFCVSLLYCRYDIFECSTKSDELKEVHQMNKSLTYTRNVWNNMTKERDIFYERNNATFSFSLVQHGVNVLVCGFEWVSLAAALHVLVYMKQWKSQLKYVCFLLWESLFNFSCLQRVS